MNFIVCPCVALGNLLKYRRDNCDGCPHYGYCKNEDVLDPEIQKIVNDHFWDLI